MGEAIYDPSREQEKLIPVAAADRPTFWAWLWDASGARNHPVLCALVCVSAVMSVVMGIGAFFAESTSVVLDATCDLIDLFSYGVNLVCEYVASYSPKSRREQIEFRGAVLSTLFLLISGARILFSAFAQIVCSEDTTWKPEYVPCSYLQERPRPILVIVLATVNLFAYIPIFIVSHYYDHGSSLPGDSINKASAMLHVWVDVCQQMTLILAGIVMYLLKAEAVQIDSLASIFVLVFMFTLTTVMWYNYLTRPQKTTDEARAVDTTAA